MLVVFGMRVSACSKGGMNMSVFGIVTSSCVILYNMTRRASDLRSARLRQFRCSIMLLTLEVLC